ncbi:MAG: acetyl-CoA C-acyltransferase [Saprospiraceae bacterium]|nr:acetyl-CoA C-acyltransferase [Saprospiraceae bacterium]
MKEVFIVGMARTPVGAFGGALSSLSVVDLGVVAVKGAMERAGISPEVVDELYMGNVLQANVGQAPAKQVAIGAGLGNNIPSTTINKVCASGMKSIMLAAQNIRLGDADIVIAGGMESMSNAPFYIPKARFGYKYGDASLIDAVVRDGLQDPYDRSMMGMAGEHCAVEKNITREDQDDFAIESYKRAQNAQENGFFDSEIVPVSIPQRKGDPKVIDTDEEPGRANFEKMRSLRTAFKKDGTITAANASKLNDGAAAVVLASKEKVEELGLKPLAKVVSYADASQEPIWFTTTPSKAMPKAIHKAGLQQSDIDFFEINEAFSCVTIANNKELNLDPAIVNVFGGAVSLGHPIGCSGARITMALVNVLQRKKGRYGCAGICNGGGGASSIVIEQIN